MVDKTSKSPSQSLIDSALPKLPLRLCHSSFRKTEALQSQRWVGGILEVSFSILRVINSLDLRESPLLEMIHDDEQDSSYQAMPIAALDKKDTNSRWFTSNSVGYTSNLAVIYDIPTNLRRYREETQISPMVVLTTTTVFPLLLILPNLESYQCWMEFDLTIIANPTQPDLGPTHMPSNSVWGLIVILKSSHLNQNFVLNFQESRSKHSSPPQRQIYSCLPELPLIWPLLLQIPPVAAQTATIYPKRDAATLEHIRIILTNPNAMTTQGEDSSNSDTLIAMKNDEDEGMDADENIDMYLNLENIKDVEMSTDSSKRKRVEEGSFISLDPRIPVIHVILPGCRVVLLFCNAIISSKGSGILAECTSCDCFIFTKIECYGYHGLDLEFSSYPHAQNEWLMLIVTYLAPNGMRVSLTMGGCRILFKCTRTSVAPTSSEQPKSGHIWLSFPPIKKSMMHITKSETPLIFITMVSSSVVRATTSALTSTKGSCFLFANEEHCSSKAIDLTAFGPRKNMFIKYCMSLDDKHIQLSKCKPLVVVFTITDTHQLPDNYNRLSPTKRNIFMQVLSSLSAPRTHVDRFFTINSMDNPYTNISWCCTTKGSRIVLWHSSHHNQPSRFIPRLDPPPYIAYIRNIFYVKQISKKLGVGTIHVGINPNTIRMGYRINLS
ncbi:hypothetical protein Cgig2_026322 [Carnegiea gigantea]|uniref:Uncharacterized protein n=1 Tax=Carnegiea gigantea TaxID=171969 RepID=A0A9Q1KCD1_9CARY|nr:hypothetical protein Cgig2_026322 [Carnegiea gigantea]